MKEIRYALKDMGGFTSFMNFLGDYIEEDFKLKTSEEADYLFCSCFGNDVLEEDAIRIQYIGENLVPDFNVYDYAIGFQYLDFGDRYLRYPIYALAYREAFLEALDKHEIGNEELNAKDRFCSFVVSNGREEDIRTQFFFQLGKYKHIDSGGKYLNNIGECLKGRQAKTEFQKRCRFAIAFENSSTPGYTTEKLLEAWQAGTIPIYWGNPDIGREFNTKAFINCHEYADFNQVIERIIEIDNDIEEYRKIMHEPILFDGSIAEQYIDKSYLGSFLTNIFKQDKQCAFRRNSYYSHFACDYVKWHRVFDVKQENVLRKLLQKIVN